MKITRLHVEFYRQRKAPATSLVSRLGLYAKHQKDFTRISVHSLIDSPGVPKFEPSNTLNLLRWARERGELEQRLEELGRWRRSVHRPERAEAYCRKWLKRIRADRKQKQEKKHD